MKKANFDPGREASRIRLRDAQLAMEKHQKELELPGVVAVWVGSRASTPYILVAVNEGRSEELRNAIPDSIDGVTVYYIEGTPHL